MLKEQALRSAKRFLSWPLAPRSFMSQASERADCVVIGAGVVGVATARELAARGREVLVLESAPTFGTGTSSRNSEVIHAGIYYPRNSLKAIFCARGRDLLYNYCSQHNVPHEKIGKLIVATSSSEIPKLNDIMKRGIQNGVPGLKIIEGSEAMRMEPELQCSKAILSPLTGIVDSHSLMLSLVLKTHFDKGVIPLWDQGEAENNGATFSYNSTVIGGHLNETRICLHIAETKSLDNGSRSLFNPEVVLIPNLVVNSTGLSAPVLAKKFDGIHNAVIPPAYYARGCYFTLNKTKSPPFKHLIYPIPVEGGFGVHVTLDLDGQLKFGPDVEWIDGLDEISGFLNKFDYSVDATRAELFYQEIRKYYPNLKDDSLQSGYSGIRPKLSGPGQPPADFVVQGADVHGVANLVNLFGIESPGLTSSLAIAEHIATRFL